MLARRCDGSYTDTPSRPHPPFRERAPLPFPPAPRPSVGSTGSRQAFVMQSVIKSKTKGRGEGHLAPDFRIKIYLMTQRASVFSNFLNFATSDHTEASGV